MEIDENLKRDDELPFLRVQEKEGDRSVDGGSGGKRWWPLVDLLEGKRWRLGI